ncbi:MAG: hypothetical protein U1E65_18575 [Myxococcota bacterium]
MRFCPRCGLVYRTGRPACALDGEALAEGSYDPLPGRELGPYAIIELIGEGRTSRVYAATDAQKRPLAVKVATGDLAADRELMKRWILEASLAELRDPTLFVRILGARQTEQGLALVALEKVEGPTLRDLLKGQGIEDGASAATLAADLAGALTILHRKERAYGCLEPRKILLVRENEQWRARLFEGGLGELGATVPEDPSFVAPEGGPPTRRRDLFALGAVLRALLVRVPTSDPQRGALSALSERLLSADPMRRPENAAEVRRALAELGHAGPAISGKPGPSGASLRPTRGDSLRPQEAAKSERPLKRSTPPTPAADVPAVKKSMLPMATVGIALTIAAVVFVYQSVNASSSGPATAEPSLKPEIVAAEPLTVEEPSPSPIAEEPDAGSVPVATKPDGGARAPAPQATAAPAVAPSPVAAAAAGAPGFTELDIQIGKALSSQGLVWDDIARLEPEKAQRWGRWYKKLESPSADVVEAHYKALAAAVDTAAKQKQSGTRTSTR